MQSKQNESSSSRVISKICAKLERNNIKVASLIVRCEGRDKNGDGKIHLRDIKEILNGILPSKDSVSEREMMHISAILKEGGDITNGVFHYIKLFDIFDETKYSSSNYQSSERWIDDDEVESEKWAYQSGTLGEWLKKAACPAEIINFKKFLARLEDYERSSGMNCKRNGDGFVVPLGPDLKASIQFYTS